MKKSRKLCFGSFGADGRDGLFEAASLTKSGNENSGPNDAVLPSDGRNDFRDPVSLCFWGKSSRKPRDSQQPNRGHKTEQNGPSLVVDGRRDDRFHGPRSDLVDQNRKENRSITTEDTYQIRQQNCQRFGWNCASAKTSE